MNTYIPETIHAPFFSVDFMIDGEKEEFIVDINGIFLLAYKLTFPESEKVQILLGKIFWKDIQNEIFCMKELLKDLADGKKCATVTYDVKKDYKDVLFNAFRLLNLKFKFEATYIGTSCFKFKIDCYIEVTPKVSFPVYPSIKIGKIDEFITIKNSEREYTIHKFLLHDTKFFSSLNSFKEGKTGIIVHESEYLESFYDFCYMNYREWEEKYQENENLDEILRFADFLDCERFFNTILSVLIKKEIKLREFLSLFEYSQKDNNYYQKVMKSLPFDVNEYENMNLFLFKELLTDRDIHVKEFPLNPNYFYQNYTSGELKKSKVYRIEINTEKTLIYMINFQPLLVDPRIIYTAFQDGKVIKNERIDDYIASIFKKGVKVVNESDFLSEDDYMTNVIGYRVHKNYDNTIILNYEFLQVEDLGNKYYRVKTGILNIYFLDENDKFKSIGYRRDGTRCRKCELITEIKRVINLDKLSVKIEFNMTNSYNNEREMIKSLHKF